MPTIQELEHQRNAILEQMRSIRSMRRGTINEQFLKVPQKGKKEPVLRGPYYVLSRWGKGKTVSQRLKTQEHLAQARKDVAEHKRFVELCLEFERVTERLGELERDNGGVTPEKKRRRSPSNRTER